MIYDYSGITYRLWGECGVFLLIGIVCLLLSGIKLKSFNKECAVAGALAIVLAFGFGIDYCLCLKDPSIESIEATFDHEERNSRVAPPLPFTMEYFFTDGSNYSFYLDVLSKKDIYPEDFVEGEEYIIYYESSTRIIVGISELGSNQS